MQAPPQQFDQQRDEREIRSLSDESGVAPAQVRTLFRSEHARLGMGAKVRSYLAVVVASNVRGMLRRVAQRRAPVRASNVAQAPHQPCAAEPRVEDGVLRRDLPSAVDTTDDMQGWENDGGKPHS